MKCINCGTELGANDVFCPNCGASVGNINVQGNGQGLGQTNTNQFSNYGPLNNSQPNVGMSNNMQSNNVQPNNIQQPNYGYTPEPKKSNAMTYVAVIAILIAIALAVVVVVKVVLPSAKGEETGKVGENSTSEDTPTQKKESTYKVTFGGFKFSIPESVETDTSDIDHLYLGNLDDEWYACISIIEGAFSRLKSNKSSMKTSLFQYISETSYGDDFSISDPKVETVDGVEFITMDVEVAGEEETVVYAGLNPSHVVGIDLFLEGNSKSDVLKVIASILDSAEYKGGTSNIEQNKLEIEDINKALENVLKDDQANTTNETSNTNETNQVAQTNQTVED